ncbi:MAG: response regulator transcription factor [Deltaproteobacteria bacterium]|nr:response regulator transcription factor [Deltaproteobacteria bacterium]
MSLNKPIQILLVSSSKFFLNGIHKVLEDKCNLKVVAKVSNGEEVEECFNETKPDFLFLDNRSALMDLNTLLNLITKKSPYTKVILLANQNEEKLNFPNVIYITKKTDSSKLRQIIERKRLRRLVSTIRSNRVNVKKR